MICLRTMPPEVPEAPPLMMPSAGHRFAAAPEHVTRDRWSGVLWADDAQDGGDGGLYFNEVRWGAR